ncbi:MAG: penicillin-binding transpeptidase domain-containing protein [Rickettsiales bacterium]
MKLITDKNFLILLVIILLLLFCIIKIIILIYDKYFLEYKLSYLIKYKSRIISQKGNCNSKYNPCDTFKIAISLMACEEGIVTSSKEPKISFSLYYPENKINCKVAQTPESWIKNSCTWYSLAIIELFNKTNIKKFKYYIDKFQYGNCDISSLGNKYSSFSNLWLSFGSLKISIEEQIEFLENFLNNKYNLNKNSIKITKEILFIEILDNNWQLYGKIGHGQDYSINNNNKILYQDWFIGWLERGDKKIIFASHLLCEKKIYQYENSNEIDYQIKKYLKNLIKTNLI